MLLLPKCRWQLERLRFSPDLDQQTKHCMTSACQVAGDSWKDFNSAQVLTRRNMVVMYGNKRQFFQPNQIAVFVRHMYPSVFIVQVGIHSRVCICCSLLCIECYILQSHVRVLPCVTMSCLTLTCWIRILPWLAVYCIGKVATSSLWPTFFICVLYKLVWLSCSLCMLIICNHIHNAWCAW